MKELMLILKIWKTTQMINSRDANTVFIYFSGHVNLFSVHVHTKGWKVDEFPDYAENVYLNQSDTVQKLQKIIKDLKSMGLEEDKEYVPKDEDEFDIFELIEEEKALDEAWEKEKEETIC